ncbi:hypothetical protein HII36_16415 [Nonomuraea sp. NN258]|uniref:hypothetical protein n=1 Tax=Nonomuraea antri TaxID=2730852 RepID=UPI00156A0B3A|nr:hypothetical protein [Nonomuraea antri]NRQ33419.1 hypothetical protein [Nonomuraea antri]
MSELERRYRSLLRWYPREHRERHEEEMLGVLMAAARPGRRRPEPRDVLDLVRGAAAIRARRAFGPASVALWRDALRVVAAVGPLMLLAYQLQSPIRGEILLVGVLIVFLAWTDRRRPAAVAAWIWTLLVGTGLFAAAMLSASGLSAEMKVGLGGAIGSFALVAAVLTGVAQPRRGLSLVGRGRILAWSGATLTVIVVTWRVETAMWEAGVPPELPLLGLGAVLCGVAARSPVGRRCVVLLSPVVPAMFPRLVTTGSWWVALPALGAAGFLIAAYRSRSLARRAVGG